MNLSKKLSGKELKGLNHFGIWLVILLIYGGLFLPFLPFEVSLLRGLGNVLPMVFLFYVNLQLVNLYFEKKRFTLYLVLTTTIVLLMGIIRVQLNLQFPEVDLSLVRQDKTNSWLFAAFMTNFGIILVSTIYQIQQNRAKNERIALETIHQQNEAQLQFLRAQINPHFLFNTLNNIYALAVAKSDNTATMVLKLSNLLRYVIYDSRAEQVLLQKESEQIKEFIELFQMRNETPVDIQYLTSGDFSGLLIEPMILIPLVENCFKHCDFDTNPNARIQIELAIVDNELVFKTFNTYNENDFQKDKVGGVGLSNIKKRLALKYANQHQIRIEATAGNFCTHLHLKTSK
ncbi:MAG: hypothetical protein DHS20C18_20370 [Saprospiraceae bacterium]|nr:MAG: hypothetical protein DHS20C18_20370 [Saprospiraceae bacterium]